MLVFYLTISGSITVCTVSDNLLNKDIVLNYNSKIGFEQKNKAKQKTAKQNSRINDID